MHTFFHELSNKDKLRFLVIETNDQHADGKNTCAENSAGDVLLASFNFWHQYDLLQALLFEGG